VRLNRLALLLVFPLLACRDSAPSIDPVVRGHLERYPLAGLEDLYSALLHGALGPAHGTQDSAGAARWLHSELASLRAGPPEPLAEDIAGDSSVLRVNLRTFVALGGNGDSLLGAFVRSGRSVTPQPFRLSKALRELATIADGGTLPWSGDSVRKFAAHVIARDHEIIGHSRAYLDAYRPAYRVVSRAELGRAVPHVPMEQWFTMPAPPFPTGRFTDDYGSTHTVSANEWLHGAYTKMEIRAWHSTKRYLLAVSDPAPGAESSAKWVRLDWVPLQMAPWTWAYCLIAYDAPTAEAAEANDTARPDTPRSGCGRFPFTRLQPVTP
jgi:hypothetical protein